MDGTRRNLAPVLGADRTTGCERSRDGGPNLIPPNVILSARAYVSARRAGDEPARAVKARVAGKPPVQGGVLTWGGGGGTARDAAPLQGVQLQLRSCRSTVCSQ